MYSFVRNTLVGACLSGSALARAQAAEPDAEPTRPNPPGDPAAANGAEIERTTTSEAVDGADEKPAWSVAVSGYFRAPIMFGVSRRPDPGSAGGERKLQLTYAPNRVLDADYNSFAYTRLPEADWAELFVTARRPHVEATIALMGRWYNWAGYEDGAAGWLPSQAWLHLDTDFSLGGLRPHVDLKGGVFWQRWGNFDKYDTYMFGRFHQAGLALELQVPLGSDTEIRLTEGFGTNRNGAPGVGTGLTLLHYSHLGLRYDELVNIGLYHNVSWTRDPTLFVPGAEPAASDLVPSGPAGAPGGGPYDEAKAARMHVLGADLDLRLPLLGHVWLAASRITLTNGWALPGIVEVLHSPGGSGIATNYLGFGEAGSTGSGSLGSLALLYEASLAGLLGQPRGTLPDLKWSVFGMLAHARRELAPDAVIPRTLTQSKWGSDFTVAVWPWLALLLRYDTVDLDADADGRSFRALTPRVIFTSHAIATESLWLQYSRYFYDDVHLETDPGQPYPNPDRHVVKVQANVSF